MIDKLIENVRIMVICLRRRYRWSQCELALRLQTSSALISKLEQRSAKNMTLKNFVKICVVFNVSPNELLGWRTKPDKPEELSDLPSFFVNNDFHTMK